MMEFGLMKHDERQADYVSAFAGDGGRSGGDTLAKRTRGRSVARMSEAKSGTSVAGNPHFVSLHAGYSLPARRDVQIPHDGAALFRANRYDRRNQQGAI
jgi:hypothetical protein